MDTTDITLIVSIASSCCLLACMVLLRRQHFIRELKWLQRSQRASVHHLRQRYQLIQPHIVGYLNSLSREAVNGAYHIPKVFAEVDRHLNVAGELIAKQRSTDLKQAAKLLDETVTIALFEGATELTKIYWEQHLESMLQLIGGELHHASKLQRTLDMPSKRGRNDTVASLESAGLTPPTSEEPSL